ncbi:MAG: ribose 5-phosphate isomerase B [Chitinophagia bacterium]|nr:ribose 5-phosphate isomerase B [Chitinophagia bacterium]
MSYVFSTSLPIAIGSDHAGFAYKEALIQWLTASGYQVKDWGAYTTDSVDYPDFAHPVSSMVENGEAAFGILLCGSANGVAMTANKHSGIRAGLCWLNEVASLVRQHNDANILCIPARFVSLQDAKEMVTTFINTPFEGGRHANRVNKIACN